ncbi:unnamed protein product, partial [Mesorhabditis spiculigera]
MRKPTDVGQHPLEPTTNSKVTPGAAGLDELDWSQPDIEIKKREWIQATFHRRECAKFIPTNKDPEKCGCGRQRAVHHDLTNLMTKFLEYPPPFQSQEAQKLFRAADALKEEGEEDTERADREFLKPEPEPEKRPKRVNERWSIRKHALALPTDAYGQIEFQGAAHPYRAQYLRLGFDADPADVMAMLDRIWDIQPPKLIITVNGGTSNFDLQPKLSRVFRKGLLKAAKTTGAWIITNGVDTGVVRHVAAALEGSGSSSRSKIVCIGITSWGTLKKREDFLGLDKEVPYHPHSFHARSRTSVLNNRHSYFLLVDNGTVNRFGADVMLRRRLEMYIAQKRKIFEQRSVPVVSVVLEGGACTVRTVMDYITNVPRVPVVICDGSGRAADLLAFAHLHIGDDGKFAEHVRLQLLSLIQRTFAFDEQAAEKVLRELSICAQQKDLITVFRLGEKQGKHDVDYAILTALLKGQNLSGPDQLALALAWNRVDIAKSDIFGVEQQHAWTQQALHNAMMEALTYDRVDFVRLLIQNGVSMHKFLDMGRLEELYNTDKGPANTLYYIVRDVVKLRKKNYHFELPAIGMVIEKLMGNAYRSSYTSSSFLKKYQIYAQKRRDLAASQKNMGKSRNASTILSRQPTEAVLQIPTLANAEQQLSETMVSALSGSRALSNHILWRSAFRNNQPNGPQPMRPPNLLETKDPLGDDDDLSTTGASSDKAGDEFRYPFSELLLWAVLTKRQEMAMCMWEHGEEALAKALVASRLYKSLAKEAAEDYLEVEICEELRKYAEEFRVLSLELLDHIYTQDDAIALQLLTYELRQWGHETCLSLAVIVNNKQFLAHPCCQILLADLWHGGLRMRSHSNAKVLMGLFLPATIPTLEFKTKEELLLQPQTAAEHEHDMNDTLSSSSSSSSEDSSSGSENTDSEDDMPHLPHHKRTAHSSMQSINTVGLGSLFHRNHKKKPSRVVKERDDPVASIEAGMANGRYEMKSVSAQPEVKDRSPEKSWWNWWGSEEPKKRKPKPVETSEGATGRKPWMVRGVQKMRKIKFRRRLYEFYAAPITTFWSWAIAFCFFLAALTYVLLIKTPPKPTWLEWLLTAYVVSFGMEHTRKFIMMDIEPFTQKCKYFFASYWNTVTTAALFTYVIGFALRTAGGPWGRVILACNAVLWVMKLLDYMSVHPKLGPYITMAGRMIQSMVYVIVMLCVSLLAFGLARQSITYPNEEWHPLLLRNIFYKPYFMLYGEVYADEIDQCGDDAWDQHLEDGTSLWQYTGNNTSNCVPGHWIPPIIMTFFLLIANVLLMSMLIATFNHIFDQTEEFSQQIWLFQRYRQVMEYESTPFFPPPLTFFWHLWMLLKYVRWRWCRKRRNLPSSVDDEKDVFDFSLKLFLKADQVEKLHDFEEDCMEELGRLKDHARNSSNDRLIFRTSERTDLMLARINDMAAKDQVHREDMRGMEARVEMMEGEIGELKDMIRQLTTSLPLVIIQALQGGQRAAGLSPAHSFIIPGLKESITQDEAPQSAGVQSTTTHPLLLEREGSTRARKRTTTYSGPSLNIDADSGLLSPALHDPFKVGSLSNLGPTQPLFNVNSSNLPRRDTISMSFRRRHHDEYTTITDSISLAADLRKRDSDDEMTGGAITEEDETKHSFDDSQLSIPQVQLPRRPKLSSSHHPGSMTELENNGVMADCELTELERDRDSEMDLPHTSRHRKKGISRSSDENEGIHVVTHLDSDESLTKSPDRPPNQPSVFRHRTVD